jgi:hypothetical protein
MTPEQEAAFELDGLRMMYNLYRREMIVGNRTHEKEFEELERKLGLPSEFEEMYHREKDMEGAAIEIERPPSL